MKSFLRVFAKKMKDDNIRNGIVSDQLTLIDTKYRICTQKLISHNFRSAVFYSKLWELERKSDQHAAKHEESYSQILHVFNTRFNKLNQSTTSPSFPAAEQLNTLMQRLSDKLDNDRDQEAMTLMRSLDVKTDIRLGLT